MPFTECKLTVTEQKIKESSLVPRSFIEKECIQSKRNIPHRKLMPECTNVTKQNCVLTNWETDEYGNQIWAGNEECDQISWQECKLVPKDVKLGKYIFPCQKIYNYSVKFQLFRRSVVATDRKLSTMNLCQDPQSGNDEVI